jgi:UDP-2,3-diacylglucosamine pyrophosphatase LpxH
MFSNGQQNGRPGLVISDLHLFARRSRGETRFASIRNQLHSTSVLVLNGDIFDFRWSTLGDGKRTLSAAIHWLRGLANDFPNCQIHFVVGNHDCTPAFLEALDELAAMLPRFQWYEYLLRLGPALFFHGDCAHRRMDDHGLSRFREHWQRDFRWSPALATAYEYVDRLGITRRVHEWHFPRRKTVERIAFYLDHVRPGWRKQTRDCFFGHTHLPFSNYEYEGIKFHNTGSAIHNLDFNPVFFETTHERDAVTARSAN